MESSRQWILASTCTGGVFKSDVHRGGIGCIVHIVMFSTSVHSVLLIASTQCWAISI